MWWRAAPGHLARVEDRLTTVNVSHARLDRDGNAVTIVRETGRFTFRQPCWPRSCSVREPPSRTLPWCCWPTAEPASSGPASRACACSQRQRLEPYGKAAPSPIVAGQQPAAEIVGRQKDVRPAVPRGGHLPADDAAAARPGRGASAGLLPRARAAHRRPLDPPRIHSRSGLRCRGRRQPHALGRERQPVRRRPQRRRGARMQPPGSASSTQGTHTPSCTTWPTCTRRP